MISLLELTTYLQGKVPDATLPHLMNMLRRSAIDFCTRSEAYRVQLDPVTVITGKNDYEVYLPEHTSVAKVLRLLFKGKQLAPTSPALMDQQLPGWETERGTPSHYFFQRGTLYLARVPNETKALGLTGTIALKPGLTAPELDEQLVEDHLTALIDGALALLYSESGSSWGNGMLADLHRRDFEIGIQEAKSRAQQDHTAKKQVMTYGGL